MKTLSLCLLTTQCLDLVALLVLVWQVRHFLRRKELPEDEPLTAEQTKYFTLRLRLICICIAVGAVLSVAQAVLRMLDI